MQFKNLSDIITAESRADMVAERSAAQEMALYMYEAFLDNLA